VRTSAEVAAARRRFGTKPLEKRWADLYSTHSRAAIRLAFLLTGDRDVSEDICQEAFERIGGRLGGLRDPQRASGYLFKTVMNLSRGHGRRLRRDRQLRGRLHNPSVTGLPDVALHDEVSRALMRLPLRQRAAVFLRYFEDLPEGQTAEILTAR
jgi:RNA polymerase sigma factor (sigma-70 family)